MDYKRYLQMIRQNSHNEPVLEEFRNNVFSHHNRRTPLDKGTSSPSAMKREVPPIQGSRTETRENSSTFAEPNARPKLRLPNRRTESFNLRSSSTQQSPWQQNTTPEGGAAEKTRWAARRRHSDRVAPNKDMYDNSNKKSFQYARNLNSQPQQQNSVPPQSSSNEQQNVNKSMYSTKSTPSLHNIGQQNQESQASRPPWQSSGVSTAQSTPSLNPADLTSNSSNYTNVPSALTNSQRSTSFDNKENLQSQISKSYSSGNIRSYSQQQQQHHNSSDWSSRSANNYENISLLETLTNSNKSFQSSPNFGHVDPNSSFAERTLDIFSKSGAGGDTRRPLSPPEPPTRDASSLKYTRISQTHEKYPSWPVTPESQATENPHGNRMQNNSRANSWSAEHSSANHNTPSEFQNKPSKLIYQPGLNPHSEEKLSPTEIKKHLEENRIRAKPKENAGNNPVLAKVVYKNDIHVNVSHEEIPANTTQNSSYKDRNYPFRKLVKSHSEGKDYMQHSPPERDIPFKHYSEMHHNLSNSAIRSPSSPPPLPDTSPPPPPKIEDVISPVVTSTQSQKPTTRRTGVVVKSTPYYNTGTQTEDLSSINETTTPNRNKLELQLNTGSSTSSPRSPKDRPSPSAVTRSPAWVKTNPVTENTASSPSPKTNQNYPSSPRDGQRGPPMLKRVPETIAEDSNERSPVKRSPQEQVPQYRLKEEDMHRLASDDKLGQSSMLNQLSKEFLGPMRYPSNNQNKPKGNPKLDEGKASDSGSQQEDTVPELRGPTKKLEDTSNFQRTSKTNMSLRKAFGTFDPLDISDDRSSRAPYAHSKSASTPQVPNKGLVHHTKQVSMDSKVVQSRANRNVEVVEVKAKSVEGPLVSDSHKIAERARLEWEASGKFVSPAGIQRTTSEQIRPLKDRRKQSEGSWGANNTQNRSSDPTLESNMSAPSAQQPSLKQHRNSSESDMSKSYEGRPRSASGRSKSSSVMDEHSKNEGDVKRTHKDALRGLYDTKKRSSTSSSIDSGPDSRVDSPSQIKDYPNPESNPRNSRSSFGSNQDLNDAHRKSASLPHNMTPPYYADPPSKSRKDRPGSARSRNSRGSSSTDAPKRIIGKDDKMELLDTTVKGASARSSVSSSSISPGLEYSPPLHPWGDNDSRGMIFRPAHEKRDKPASVNTDTSQPPQQQTNQKDDSEETIPKSLNISGSSSGSSSSPARPLSNSTGFQMGQNNVFEDGEESPPPTLPPRNYRQPNKPREAPTEPSQNHNSFYRENSYNDKQRISSNSDANANSGTDYGYETTPRAESYANQLRQSARRLSQSKSMSLLGGGGHRGFQPKQDFNKTNYPVAQSRPVEKPPLLQEATVPPIYRSTVVPNNLNFVGLENNKRSLDEAPSPGGPKRTNPNTEVPQGVQSQNTDNRSSLGASSSSSYNEGDTTITNKRPASYSSSVTSGTSSGPYHSPQQSNLSGGSSYHSPQQSTLSSTGSSDYYSSKDPVTTPTVPPKMRGREEGDFQIPPPPPQETSFMDDSLPPPPPEILANNPEEQQKEYSNESYIFNKGSYRQGFDGNYRRVDYNPASPSYTRRPQMKQEPEGYNTVNPQDTMATTVMGDRKGSFDNNYKMDTKSIETPPWARHGNNSPVFHRPRWEPADGEKGNQTGEGFQTPQKSDPNSDSQYTESPSVRAFVQNFESTHSRLTDSRYNRNNPNNSESAPQRKIQDIKESLMRSSNENLSTIASSDRLGTSSENVSKLTLSSGRGDQSKNQKLELTQPKFVHHEINNKHNTAQPHNVVRMNNTNLQKSHSRDDSSPQGVGQMPPPSQTQQSQIPPHSVGQIPPQSFSQVPSQNNGQSNGQIASSGPVPQTPMSPRDNPQTPTEPQAHSQSPPKASPKSESPASRRRRRRSAEKAKNTSAHTEPEAKLTITHVRQKSSEEVVCEEQAAILASRLREAEEKELSEAILPPPEHKTSADYMSGLFERTVKLSRTPSQRVQMIHSKNVERKGSMPKRSPESVVPANSAYWSSAGTANLQNKMREEGVKADDILQQSTPLEKQKEELVTRINKKLEILNEEKTMMAEEIRENDKLGKEVTTVVEQKLQNKAELNKYRSYVEDLEKIMNLLINLLGRLARAENAVMSLPEDASEKLKATLVTKRDNVSEKLDDAKMLKEGIDKRSKTVSTFLQKSLTDEEYGDYEYFVKMKAKLTMDHQEIEDKIRLGQEQLAALNKSMEQSTA